MIVVTVKVFPKPEHKNEFINAFLDVSNLVYQEQGCIEYEMHVPVNSSEQFFIF